MAALILRITIWLVMLAVLGVCVAKDYDYPLVMFALRIVWDHFGSFEATLEPPVRWGIWSVLLGTTWCFTSWMWSSLSSKNAPRTASPSAAVEPARERRAEAAMREAGPIVPVVPTYAPAVPVAPAYNNCGNTAFGSNCQVYTSCTFATRQPAMSMESCKRLSESMRQLLDE